jgi:uncharacterized protein YbaP (TraB family)
MVVRFAVAIIAPLLLLITGCSDQPDAPAGETPQPAPLLYEIASADGTTEGWIVGTIHALPASVEWRTPAIETVVRDADLLVVEVGNLTDRDAGASIYFSLARSPGLPPIHQRLPHDLRPQLAALLARGGVEAKELAFEETWAAALALARIDAPGDPANGVDIALIKAFAGREVRELEGLRGQLSIFDRLPEATQRAMLASVVRESGANASDPERLQRAWLRGDAAAIEASTHEGILADPALRETLLVARNRRWIAVLVPMLAKAPRPLIAVGAAHLVGADGLVALLANSGYRVRRIS